MKRYIKSNYDVADLVESKLNQWIDQGKNDVEIDDEIFDLGGDELTIDELRRRGRIDETGHYVYSSIKCSTKVNIKKQYSSDGRKLTGYRWVALIDDKKVGSGFAHTAYDANLAGEQFIKKHKYDNVKDNSVCPNCGNEDGSWNGEMCSDCGYEISSSINVDTDLP